MDEAVKRYYAGFPEEAIDMLKPLALSGDPDAQYLLGNILYSLSKGVGFTDIDDPVKWYKMAADQDSAAANYALGAIFHNKWNESRDQKDAANAIVYYQIAIELGYAKAQQPLDKIKFRSDISADTAAILVKEQAAMSIPKSETSVPMPDSDISSLASNESQVPGVSSTDMSHTTIKSEPLEMPVIASRVPVKIKQTAAKPDDEVMVSAIESGPLDKPVMAAKEPVEIAQTTDNTDIGVTASVMKSVPTEKLEVAAKDPIKIVQMADEPDDEVMVSVTLEEIANQCQNYTETGFNLYAETIEGALLSGMTAVVAVKPDATESGRFLINLSSNLSGLVIFVVLQDVPEKVALGFEKGTNYAINGVIVSSRVVGSDCTIRALYQ